jgi:hypothetical protein
MLVFALFCFVVKGKPPCHAGKKISLDKPACVWFKSYFLFFYPGAAGAVVMVSRNWKGSRLQLQRPAG